MLQVELPFELALRVEQVAKPSPAPSRRSRKYGGAQGLQFIGVGAEPFVLSQAGLLETHWFRSPTGYVLGVEPTIEAAATENIDVGALAALRIRRSVPRKTVESAQSEAWTLLHDLRKTHAEFSAAVRLANELSFLVAALLQSTEQLEQQQSQVVETNADGNLSVRLDALQRVLRGESLIGLASSDEKALALVFGDALLFDVSLLGVGSPFFARFRPHLTFNREVNIGTLIAFVSLSWTISHTPIPPVPPGPPTDPVRIECGVKDVSPNRNVDTHKQSCAMYRKDLAKGGVKASQRFLIALGFDVGRIDGVEGPRTRAARDEFCSSQGIVCTSVTGSAFQDALIEAMASRFPVRKVR